MTDEIITANGFIRRREDYNFSNHTETDADEYIKLSRRSKISIIILSVIVGLFSIIVMVPSSRTYFKRGKYFKFTTNTQNLTSFAKQSEFIEAKTEIVECSPKYLEEKDLYEGCFPKKCKRYVTDNLVTLKEADELLAIIRKALKVGSSAGGATAINLHTGMMGVDNTHINIYEHESTADLFTDSDFSFLNAMKDKIKHATAKVFDIEPDKMYLTNPFFLTELNPKDPVTKLDVYWKTHIDKNQFNAFHYSTVTYLADYGVDFESGELVFVDKQVNKTIEPKKGRVVMFTSGSENTHRIEKLTSGRRYTMFVAFTCDKNFAIEDPSIKKFQQHTATPQAAFI